MNPHGSIICSGQAPTKSSPKAYRRPTTDWVIRSPEFPPHWLRDASPSPAPFTPRACRSECARHEHVLHACAKGMCRRSSHRDCRGSEIAKVAGWAITLHKLKNRRGCLRFFLLLNPGRWRCAPTRLAIQSKMPLSG